MKRLFGGIILTMILLLLMVCVVEGQVLPITHYTPESELNPLPSAEVTQVYQDDIGYLWLNVYSSGLIRYTGVEMEEYGLKDGLRDLSVWDITQGPTGRLWVSSNTGLVVSEKPLADYKAGQRIRFLAEYQGVELVSVAINHNRMSTDNAGRLWVGTERLGLVRYQFNLNGELLADTISTAHNGVEDDVPVRSVTARKDGSVWVALLGGDLLRFGTNDKMEVYSPGNQQSTNTLYESVDSTLWGGQQKGRIWRFDDSRDRFLEVTTLQGHNISDITSDSDGMIWIASEGAGVLQLDPNVNEVVTSYDRANGFLSDIIYNILEDREHNIWFAQSGGVSKLRYNYKAFKNIKATSVGGEPPVLPSPAINTVLPADYKQSPCMLWAGTAEGGLTCVNKDYGSEIIDNDKGLSGNWVNGLASDAMGRLWIGTTNGINSLTFNNTDAVEGFSKVYEGALFGESYSLMAYPTAAILATQVLEMPIMGNLENSIQSVWFSGYREIYVVVQDHLYAIGSNWGLPAAIYHSVAFDGEGYLWVGSRDRGIYRSKEPLTVQKLQEGLISNSGSDFFELWWSTENGASSNQIENLLFHQNAMWVGTPSGLTAIEGSTNILYHLTINDGLKANNASSIYPSPITGNLWVGTNKGLAEIDPKEGKVLKTVTRSDGLVDNEVWYYGSVKVDEQGVLYFGTAKGISIYDPAQDIDNTVPPVVRLTKISADEVPGERNEFNFEYAALSYGNERQVYYQTRLIGFEKEWSQIKNEVRASYTNLSAYFLPKKYSFEVRAVNEAGIWSDDILTYSFHVTPIWWLRWWAFVGYFVIVSAGVIVVDRIQRTRLIKKEREIALLRENELKAETAEAKAKALQAENDLKATELEKARELEKAYYELKATQKRLVQSEKMASLGRLSTGIAHEIKNPLNFINNFAELSKDLVDELRVAIKDNDTDEIEFIMENLSFNTKKIEEHGERADTIVQAMMRQSQNTKSTFETVDLKEVVKDAIDQAYYSKKTIAADFEVRISTDIDSNIPSLSLNAPQLSKSLQNIIENALDAVCDYEKNKQNENEYIPKIEVFVKRKEAEIEIIVSDNGPGIPENIQERIFEPFFTTKPTGEATGLGLSFSYDIITQIHEGQLKFESEQGSGTSFVIILPIPKIA